MNVKDFKVGEKAYIIAKGNIAEVEIAKVGRKFVHVKGGSYGFFLRSEDDNFLVENKDWGYADELFLTRQDAENEIEFSMLLTSVHKATEYSRLTKLSLDQLRRINQILQE